MAEISTRQATAIRDVPRSCTCRWRYLQLPARWELSDFVPGCVWHRRWSA